MDDKGQKFTSERASGIKRVLDTVNETFPYYTELIKKVLRENLYDGPSIPMPRSTPNELMCDVIANLSRNEMEKCQLLNRRFNTLIEQQADTLPLYSFGWIEIVHDERFGHHYYEAVLMTCGRSRQKRISLVKDFYQTDENLVLDDHRFHFEDGDKYMKCMKHVIVSSLSFKRINRETNERFWMFIRKLHELAGGKIKVQQMYSTEELSAADLQRFTGDYFAVKNMDLLLSSMIEEPIDYSRGYDSEEITIYQGSVRDYPSIINFLDDARFPNPEKYSMVLLTEDLDQADLFKNWLQLMSRQFDPTALIPKLEIAVLDGEATEHSISFFNELLSYLKSYPKSIENQVRKANYGNEQFYNAWHTYTVKQTETYTLKVKFMYEYARVLPGDPERNYGNVNSDLTSLGPDMIIATYFVVEKL